MGGHREGSILGWGGRRCIGGKGKRKSRKVSGGRWTSRIEDKMGGYEDEMG